MAITGAVGAALRQEAPYQAEIAMGAQLILDFQGARSGRRPYYWHRGTRYTSPDKIPGWSFARNSVGYAQDSTGKLIQFPANTPRITDRGLLIEEARTNKVSIVNANPTSTTGINFAFSGGAASISVVDDTAALAAAGLLEICPSGKVFKIDYSGVAYALAIIGGSAGNTNPHIGSVWYRDANGMSLGMSGNELSKVNPGSATYVRGTSLAGAPSVAGRALQIATGSGSGALYFILPQLEEGSFVTSEIVTNGAAAARAADSASISGLAQILSPPLTLFVEADLPLGDGVDRYLASLSDGTTSNALTTRRSASNGIRISGSGGGVDVYGYSGARITKVSARYRTGSVAGAVDGASIGTYAGSASGLSVLELGSREGFTGNGKANGYLRRLMAFGDLDDTQRVRLTA